MKSTPLNHMAWYWTIPSGSHGLSVVECLRKYLVDTSPAAPLAKDFVRIYSPKEVACQVLPSNSPEKENVNLPRTAYLYIYDFSCYVNKELLPKDYLLMFHIRVLSYYNLRLGALRQGQ